jgi:hypothetical protein
MVDLRGDEIAETCCAGGDVVVRDYSLSVLLGRNRCGVNVA